MMSFMALFSNLDDYIKYLIGNAVNAKRLLFRTFDYSLEFGLILVKRGVATMTKIDENTVGGRLKTWRKHLNLTGEELGKLCGIHVGMIRKYETNHAMPGGDTLTSLSKKTGLNVQWLLMGEGKMGTEPSETAKREIALMRLLDELDPIKRDNLLNEFFARIQDAKQIEELKGIVENLQKSVAA